MGVLLLLLSMKWLWLWIGLLIGLILLVVMGKKPKVSGSGDISVSGGDTLAVRNKNLGNIRYSPANNWLGQVGQNSGFVVFESYRLGVRALIKLIDRYVDVYGLKTVYQVLCRWAPIEDGNDPVAYAKAVETLTGLKPHDQITKENMWKLVKGMAWVEGRAGVDDAELQALVNAYSST